MASSTKWLLLLISCFVMLRVGHGAPAPDASDSAEQPLDGNYLVNLGRKFNYPLLRLIGQVITNKGVVDGGQIQKNLTDKLCRLHPCGEWGEWNACPVKNGFSVVTRTRVCHKATDICAYDGQTEYSTTESKVCGRMCPSTYNVTGEYCLRLYTTLSNMETATKACQDDGGHVVRLDSQAKTDAVHALLKSYGKRGGVIWLNGKRAAQAGPWAFSYGVDTTYSNWKSGEPTNGSAELCMVEKGDPRVWWDRSCTETYMNVCEVL